MKIQICCEIVKNFKRSCGLMDKALVFGTKDCRFESYQDHISIDTLAEWLRRRPAKPMGSPRVGSNPTGVVFGMAVVAGSQSPQGL